MIRNTVSGRGSGGGGTLVFGHLSKSCVCTFIRLEDVVRQGYPRQNVLCKRCINDQVYLSNPSKSSANGGCTDKKQVG